MEARRRVLPRERAAPRRRAAGVCTDNATDSTDSPIGRISEIVQPTDAQRPALDELRAANAQAIDILKAGCPNHLPSTPTGRLAAMESRLQVMLQAVDTVRPALNRFYQSLNDEQKARFNAMSPETIHRRRRPARLHQVLRRAHAWGDRSADRPHCPGGAADVGTAGCARRIQGCVHQGGGSAQGQLPSYQSLTPTGRVESMEKRLQATLGAVTPCSPR